MQYDAPAISVKQVSKSFKLPKERVSSIKGLFVGMFRGKRTYNKQRVLNNISFDIGKGEFFGIVGRNGSGKSTLLKLLAGIYSPEHGSIEINGKLTPFIELGVGFSPDLTGRENVFLNGALLGFNRKEMDAMYDDIVDFAELHGFMDQKLKNYSSGMQVRLAFSIAIKAQNDILLLDEVLAVGDEAFQSKCLDIFEQYKANDQTVILVTHDMEAVRKFCDRALLINDGHIMQIGNPREIADTYSELNRDSGSEVPDIKMSKISSIKTILTIVGSSIKQKDKPVFFDIGQQATLSIRWDDTLNVDSVMVDLFKNSGEHVSGFNTKREDVQVSGNSVAVDVKLELSPDKYYFSVQTRDKEEKPLETNYKTSKFTINRSWKDGIDLWSGMMPIEHKWHKE